MSDLKQWGLGALVGVPLMVVSTLAVAATPSGGKTVTMSLAGTPALTAAAVPSTLDIDISGWVAADAFGGALNSFVLPDVGAGTVVQGYDWIGLTISTTGFAYFSDFQLSVNDLDANNEISDWLDWQPSLVEEGGTLGPLTGAWGGPAGIPGFFGEGAPFVASTGLLYVTVFNAFPAFGTVVVDAGTLRLHLAPIPEPSTYGLMALGLLGVAAAARRRKAD